MKQKAAWEETAEELVRHVRNLLEDHEDALRAGLRDSIGDEAARDQLRLLESLTQALEIELWRTGSTPRRRIGGAVASALMFTLGGIAATLITLSTTTVYNSVTEAEAKADTVIVQCGESARIERRKREETLFRPGDVRDMATSIRVEDPVDTSTFNHPRPR